MPGSNPILRHWQIELKIFNKNLFILQQTLDSTAVHDLRVAIKKLRSYFRLYQSLFEKKDVEKFFSGTSRLFSVLGKYRNIQMSRQLLLSSAKKNNQLLDFLFAHLQTLQNQTGKYGKQELAKYDMSDLNELTKQINVDLENFTVEETLKMLRETIFSLLEKIKHDLRHFKEKSHLIRKALKDIFYRLKIFENNPPLSNAQMKSIDKILNHLGNIQDLEVLITNLKNFRKMVLPKDTEEYNAVKKIEAGAKNKKTTLLNKAEKMTENLLRDL